MKKFALLFALLAAAGIAQAEVSVFGTMDAGYGSFKAPGGTAQSTVVSGGMTTSNIGFAGKEDLGNGNTAVFELSSFVNLADGAVQGGSTVNTFTRSAFAGVSNKQYGTVTLGRQSNPSFLPTILFNAYGDSSVYGPLWRATYFGNSGNPTPQVYNDTAWDSSAAYTSPSIGGATVTVVGAKGTNGNNSGANVLYFKGDLGLTGYWQRTEVNSTGAFIPNIFTANKPATAWGLGGSYDVKVAKLFATFQEGKSASANIDGKTMQVSALVPMGPGNIMAEYAHSKVTGVSDKTFNDWAVGYDYALGKRSDLYVSAGQTGVTGLTSGRTIGAGMRLKF